MAVGICHAVPALIRDIGTDLTSLIPFGVILMGLAAFPAAVHLSLLPADGRMQRIIVWCLLTMVLLLGPFLAFEPELMDLMNSANIYIWGNDGLCLWIILLPVWLGMWLIFFRIDREGQRVMRLVWKKEEAS
jgi:hypothetical protein